MGKESGERIYGVDALRAAAVFAVVWIHGSDTNATARWIQTWAGFAVPAFVMMSAYLLQRGCLNDGNLTWPLLMRRRLSRMLPPYVAWSLIYVALRWFKHAYLAKEGGLSIDWMNVLACGGASYQLWFIPALVLYTLLFGGVAISFRFGLGNARSAAALFAGGAFMLWAGGEAAAVISVPHAYELFARATLAHAGYFLIGFSICLAAALPAYRRVPQAISGIASAAQAVALYSVAGWLSKVVNAGFAITLFAFAERPRHANNVRWIRLLAELAMGIYMCHAIFVEGLQMVLPGVGLEISRFDTTLFVIVMSFLISAATCFALSRIPATRWLVA